MKKGFTLIELLAVVIILMTILMIAIPTVKKITDNSKINSLKLSTEKIISKLKSTNYENKLLGKTNITSGDCKTLFDMDEGYSSCTYSITNGVVSVKIIGAGKFKEFASYGVDSEVYAGKIKNTLTFDANGGTGEAEPKEITFGSTYGELPTVTKTGETFLGWYDDNNNLITSSSIVNALEDQTLYAQWTTSAYTYSYTGNGSVTISLINTD